MVQVAVQRSRMEAWPKKMVMVALLCVAMLLIALMKSSTEETNVTLLDVSSTSAKEAVSQAERISHSNVKSGGAFDSLKPATPDLSSVKLAAANTRARESPDLSAFQGCTISDIEKMDPEKPFKPFWIPSYPNTDNGIVSNLIEHLTGIKSGSKSYYASMKGRLRHCFATNAVTVSCEQAHPIVAVKPESKTNKFQKQVVVAIRNPTTTLPAHHQDKAVKYHNVKGQVSLDSWTRTREAYLPEMMKSWKSVVESWSNMSDYTVALYLPFEQLLDPIRGPEVVRELSALIKSGGFPIARDEDLSCVWYKSVRHVFDSDKNVYYPYASDYIPGFNHTEIGIIDQELSNLLELYPEDTSLNEILSQYRVDLKQNPPLDS